MAVQTKPTHFSQFIHKILSCREVRRNELELRAKGLGSLNDQSVHVSYSSCSLPSEVRNLVWEQDS